MLELQNVYKTFEGRSVLADVNLTVVKGATHALIGVAWSTIERIHLSFYSP
jgi:ABC-type sugar transport system ATPase subunit